MAQNYRSSGDRLSLIAAAARTSGSLTYESGFAVIPITDAASGARYAGALVGVWDIPLVASAAVGDDVYISTDGNNTVTRAAHGTAPSAGTIVVGRVVGTPTQTLDPTGEEPPAGYMSVRLSSAGQV